MTKEKERQQKENCNRQSNTSQQSFEPSGVVREEAYADITTCIDRVRVRTVVRVKVKIGVMVRVRVRVRGYGYG